MFEDHSANSRMTDCKNKDDFRICSADISQKYILHWSPQEENKFMFKRQYVSSSRSVPKRSKRFVRYKISRSLNFDVANCQNSSSDSSSLDCDKYLSRSAKIMRALNFNSSPSYYGKTRIKRSLNFNSTPSPKRFSHKGRGVRKASSLNLNALSPGSDNKLLNFDDSHSDSANNSLVFTSSESIDENQNETPSRQNLKIREPLNFSTPTANMSKRSPRSSTSFSPLLRSGLKERIDNIIYITATPNPQSLKRSKSRLKHTDDLSVSTPRNLFREFHDADDDRPRTPENIVRIVPESMSAIKRSHKKERSSRWNERTGTHSTNASAKDNTAASDPTVDSNLTPQMCRKYVSCTSSSSPDSKKDRSWMESPACHSEAVLSDTGSLFDYKEVEENLSKKLEGKMANFSSSSDLESSACHSEAVLSDTGSLFDYKEVEGNLSKKLESKMANFSSSSDGDFDFRGFETKVEHETDEEEEIDRKVPISQLMEANLSTSFVDPDVKRMDDGPTTPEPTGPSSSKAVTPENRINIFEHLLRDSIKKSHKKIKDENKKKLFSPIVMRFKNDTLKQENVVQPRHTVDACESDIHRENAPAESARVERATTPEKVNSSRLLLSQFSSVKKSHRKDKHNKILTSFMKRQEYFNRDMESLKDSRDKTEGASSMEDLSAYESNVHEEMETFEKEGEFEHDTSIEEGTSYDKLSHSKRRKSLDAPLDPNESSDDPQQLDIVKQEFRIFTPLKRRRSVNATYAKGYSCVYRVPNDREDVSEEDIADITSSRCLTPVATLGESSIKTEEKDSVDLETATCSPNEQSGRSTPQNMSTSTLYSNVDSIKKSHKKNKRGCNLRKETPAETSKANEEGKLELASSRNVEDPSKSVDYVESCVEQVYPSTSKRNNATSPGRTSSSTLMTKNHSGRTSPGVPLPSTSITHDYGGKSNVISPSTPPPSTSATKDHGGRINVSSPNMLPSTSTAKHHGGRSILISPNNTPPSTSIVREQVGRSSAISLSKTPPNTLKTKDYMRLMQNTSIKRSHKKERDQKKRYELPSDGAHELSDDGSLFGDEERIACADDDESLAESRGELGIRRK